MKARSMRPGTHKVSDGFTAFVVDQLDELKATARPMFGGVGLYSRGVFFGLLTCRVSSDQSLLENSASRLVE